MTLAEAAANVGAGVVYRPYPGGPAEDGVITSVGPQYVFVRYRGDQHAKATAPDDLSFTAAPIPAQAPIPTLEG